MRLNQVIVTGGAGYIGSHIAVALVQSGYVPVILDNFSNSHPKILDQLELLLKFRPRFFEIDCCDKVALDSVFTECLKEGPIAGVIHLAAFKAVGESSAEPLKYYHNNISSTCALLDTMNRHSINSFVFSSSCTVYGQPTQIPVDESAPFLLAESPYGFTKQICERLISDAHSASSTLSFVSLRYFNPVGAHPSGLIGEFPTGQPNNLVPFLTQAAAGIRDSLTVFGNDYATEDGTCIRDYVHVMDLANSHVAALGWLQEQENACETFNIGTGRGLSVMQVIKAFESTNKVEVPYSIGPRRAGDIEAIYADAQKAWKVIGWKCEYTIEEALRDAWNWQKKLNKSR
jgi:UDP-glucose 4-epimerase